jgi:hypothetical protein
MLRARASVAIGMVFIAIAAITAHDLFGTTWSNHCDPGNARFNILKTDPVVSFRARGELFAYESDGADNSWLCSGPSLSVTHFGDPAMMYAQLRAKFVQSGWSGLGDTNAVDPDWSIYYKDTGGAVPFTEPTRGFLIRASVRKQWVGAAVRLSASGLHDGEMGFQ